ncbi:MAG: ADP-ribosylglycohydrolase family protein [Verrucomicrobia bacterium]|nr:ADP-ribosylglycohydrolase family protein [Verrucomicrobiota bacterium]
MKKTALVAVMAALAVPSLPAQVALTRADYVDRVQAIWTGQIIAVLVAMPFEHKTASVVPIDRLPMLWAGKPATFAPVDDDWYYEMCAVRAFEKHGIGLTVGQLGQQWLENRCGSWGSSEQARLNLEKGITAPDCGHPRYNKLWFTLGPQFSSDLYGALAPGQPNVAGRLAREFGHINGYAEGTDGAVFTAVTISLGFTIQDPQAVIRQAVRILHPSSPYRQSIELVIALADAGKFFEEIVTAIEDRWHVEYPATNNAVANGGIVAAGLWFGRGDFWTTLNLIARAADFTDADCNGANAASVIGAMHGMKALPAALVAQLNDRIVGKGMGTVKEFTPPVDESISGLARRTAAIGEKILLAERATLEGDTLRLPGSAVVTQPAERFVLGDLARTWNPDWTLERAGFGGAGGGMAGIRGITHLQGDILATYPRDEVRACLLRRTVKPGAGSRLTFEAGSEPGRAWELSVYADNKLLLKDVVSASAAGREWRTLDLDLKEFAGREVTLRLYQRVFVPNRIAGNALWRNLQLK